ncbi:type II toxin-antitoxin system RelE/ParE family toxin [uncultured Brevundimonas sp.]|uniref:type II toxin-antitoxin system RelE/ParE family toxin n=1 Tax=uncultured Brevundimonas sp. TaxID=213418 RepID=UPI0025D1B9A7|nr:type II toxin-antitoxin system RelE/ParE family toxin [uncultured Brevundimonas sp.]
MNYRVRLLPPARSDLIRVSNFLADVSPGAALRAADVLDGALRTLGTFPERAPKNRIGGRDMIVRFGQAGYVIRYRVEGANVVVTRIFHTLEDRSA